MGCVILIDGYVWDWRHPLELPVTNLIRGIPQI
jgi:hypothetical protein